MCGKASPVSRGRWLTLISVALPAVFLVLWMVGVVSLPPVFPAAAMAVLALVVVDGALVAEAPRMRPDLGRRETETRRKRVLIVGAGDSARRAAAELESDGSYQIVGFVTDDARDTGGEKVLGETGEIPSLVSRLGIDQVIVAEAPAWQRQLTEMLAPEYRHAVGIHVVPGLYEARVGGMQFHRVRDLPLVDLTARTHSELYLAFKRSMDLAFSVIGLIVAAPLMALAALAVKVTSPGPALFRQERVGEGGKTFTILKLRTMVVDAEKKTGPVLSAGKSDPRITPVGKFLRATRLDELPQLINVLKGEMSIVGPRPERPCFVSRYELEIPGYSGRHQMKPGVTGLAQVNGGYAIDAELKLRYDLLYIHNASPIVDLKLIFQTLLTVVRRTGQ
jgi:exopolysaccharide biosynthesis polyprenyl glycosylphosphotransferase